MSANITERCIIFGTALYVYTRLIRAFATSEIGKIEGLNLIILSIWTWCTHSIGSPVSNKDEKISHKLWGTDEKCYRCFTFGEMAIVAQAITLLIIESFIVTINKFELIDLPPFRSHVPSEMTIFQLALILGMFLIGFTLSSLLLHSRYLAQIPKWKKKCVENIENKKKWVAILIYCGTLIMVFLIGKWTIYFTLESNHRIFLCIYWITAITISLILFLQLSSYRKTVSLNTKRKYFHGLAMIMFIPGCLYEPKFMHLAFSVAFAALIFLEYLRYFAVYPFGKQLHLFLNEFLDHRDSGPIITSHLYLLIGCAGCIWLKGLVEFNPCKSFGYIDVRPWRFYVIGRRYGCHKWPGTSKTVEGFVAFIFFQLLGVFVLSKFWMADNMWPKNENWTTYTIKVSLSDDIATPVMIATQKEMSEAGLPLEWRDYCAHLALRLNKCRNSTWFLPWKCQDERHTYEKCQYEDETDWDNITVIRKRSDQAKVAKGDSNINAARRAGAVVGVERKVAGGTNRSHSNTEHQKIAKLDRDNEVAPPPKVSLTVGKAIQQARQAKGLTQKELGQKVNEKANVINDYEMSRTIPNQQILAKLERVLGVKLRGKNVKGDTGDNTQTPEYLVVIILEGTDRLK
ncbi:6401_t:CDS:10 [Entrophospora sp. SA101]|nr:6401_t:CDS:10 [Entrophospora sp. SA101]